MWVAARYPGLAPYNGVLRLVRNRAKNATNKAKVAFNESPTCTVCQRSRLDHHNQGVIRAKVRICPGLKPVCRDVYI